MRHDREGRGYDLLPQRSREEGDDVVIEALMKRSAVETRIQSWKNYDRPGRQSAEFAFGGGRA
jgi:hypothetical protein